jgi:hypothetical protein
MIKDTKQISQSQKTNLELLQDGALLANQIVTDNTLCVVEVVNKVALGVLNVLKKLVALGPEVRCVGLGNLKVLNG